MNEKSVKAFRILGTFSMLLMVIASAIGTIKGIYLIWLMPVPWLFAYVIAFYVCRYIQGRPQESLRHRLVIKLNGMLVPNSLFSDSQLGQIRDLLVNVMLIGITVFGNFFAVLLLIGMITQK